MSYSRLKLACIQKWLGLESLDLQILVSTKRKTPVLKYGGCSKSLLRNETFGLTAEESAFQYWAGHYIGNTHIIDSREGK
jgi:hypothetical protein